MRARFAVHRGDTATAAAWLEESARLWPSTRADVERAVTRARTALPAVAFEAAWVDGLDLSVADAIALALTR